MINRLALVGVFLLLAMAAIAAGWYVFSREDEADASAHLRRLSNQRRDRTYAIRYEGNSAPNGDGGPLEFAQIPGTGFRLALPSAIEATFDEDPPLSDDIMAGGDILVGNAEGFYSCRTERRSCRTADGLERLFLGAFFASFEYTPDDEPAPAFEGPHRVKRVADIMLAGEIASCFRVEAEPPATNEELPATLCYSDDGIPLLIEYAESSKLTGVELRREVQPTAFELPFMFVQSVYDE